jgi:hypothetical protein
MGQGGCTEPLLFLSRHAPGWMGVSAGQSRIQFALFTWLRATCGTADHQGDFFRGFHTFIMGDCSAEIWSIVTGLIVGRFRIGQFHLD